MGGVGLLLIEESKVHHAAEVLLIPDDPGEFAASTVDVQHIDIKSVFVIRKKDAITATGRASLVEAELGVIKIAVGIGGYGHGVGAYDDGDGLDGGLRGYAIGASVIGMVVDAKEVLLHVHHLVLRREENARPDGDLDIVAFEDHVVAAYFFYRQGAKRRLADAFIHACQCEAGHVCPDVLFADLGEVVLFAAIVGEVQVLSCDGGCDEYGQQT